MPARPSRHQPPRHGAGRPRRRQRFAWLVAVLLAGGAVGACTTLAGDSPHGHHHDGSSTSSSSSTASVTTSTLTRPTSFNVGIVTFDWKDTTRNTPDPASGGQLPGRVLTTQVRYPTTRGAAGVETPGARPATSDGPFPVIVFAHGFDVDPSIYQPLLDAWVRAGFVVVSPIFPDANAERIAALGGPLSVKGTEAEDDIVNEPADVVFVIKQFTAVDEPGSGSALAGLGNLSELALAGQSDGANVVAALAFGTAFTADWSSIVPEPKAVLVLSGEALNSGPGGVANGWSSGPASPDVLQVQSDADTCNAAQYAADLYASLANAPVHFFELLHGASHLQPYTNAVAGPNPYAPVVQHVTVDFLRFAFGVRRPRVTLEAVEAAGTGPVSQMFSVPATIGPAIAHAPGQSPAGCAAQAPS